MGGFRIGRTFARHVYADNPRAAALGALARNFATGPKSAIPIGAGVEVLWNAIDAGASPNQDVPITPRSTGIVRISGIITISNGAAAQPIQITIRVGGVDLFVPNNLISTVAALGQVAMPFLAETIPAETPVGVTTNVRIFVAGDNGTTAVLQEGSSIDLQEVPIATG